MGNLTPTVRGLLIINIFVFIANAFIGQGSLEQLGILWYIEFPEFKPWQLMTHMFLHADFMHLLGNMMGLFFFGPWLERSWGARNFFIFYFACGFAGAAFQMGSFGNSYHQINPTVVEASDELKAQKRAIINLRKNPTVELTKAYLKKYNVDSYNKIEKSGFFKTSKEILKRSEELKKLDTTQLNDSLQILVLKTEAKRKQILAELGGLAAKIDREAGRQNAKSLSELEVFRSRGYGLKMLGASGAIFGILVAFALFFPNVKMMLLFPPIPLKAKYFVLIYMAVTIYAAGGGNIGMSNVAHLAHLGGAVIGALLTRFWLWKFRPR